MSDPVIEKLEPGLRFVHGLPEMVQAEINRLGDTYACTNLFFYVVDNHLEVNATLIHMREIRKAQFMQGAMPPGARRQ